MTDVGWEPQDGQAGPGAAAPDPVPGDFPQVLAGVRESTAGLLGSLSPLTERDVRRNSLMPGWTIGHVLSHLARNADAMVRSLGGALRHEPTAMYPHGARGRDADIQAGARRPIGEIVADLTEAARRLDDAWTAMTPDAWISGAIIRSGRLAAWRTVGARWSEVELHWVDMDTGHGPDAWPERFSRLLMRTLTERTMIGRPLDDRLPPEIRLELASIDTGEHWSAGPRPARTIRVHGPSWALASWLAGRSEPVRPALELTGGGELPQLAPWW
ncbi:MAG TPA: maleylpyruvate isomerase family mycothiol-dependent enzyme [Streptosporangiaceae bacterium]|jgi:maleylpyruvate isomerase